jgi:hypothetical protein
MFDWLKPKVSSQKDNVDPAPKKDRSALIKDAMVNARAARESIGEDTLDRVLDIMNKKKQAQAHQPVNPSEQARKILQSMDKGHVADHLKDIMQTHTSPPSKH